nr:PREDICTED: uncharacterized protein LOC105662418 [Megachile rotundata]
MGYHTRKVLFVSVRNKYCCICARASKLNVTVREHECYKNWGTNQSSTSMESDIILEGFRCSLEMYGLIYYKYIGDGDSNVLKKLRDFPPYKNVVAEKIECINHLLRNLCKKIEEISKSGGRSLLKLRKIVAQSSKAFRINITRAATFRRNSDATWENKIAGLIKDLSNIPSHIFGEHKDCSSLPYFSNEEIKEGEENLVPQLQMAGLYAKIEYAMKRIIDNAESVLYNYTSNSVESCNAVIAKMIGGKRINFAKRGSYQTRVKASVLHYNTSKALSTACCTIGKVPPIRAVEVEKMKMRQRARYALRVKTALELGAPVRRSKYAAKAFRADKDYGPNAERPDIDDNMYEQLKANFYETLFNQQRNRDVLEYVTRGQHANPQWHYTRRTLLTASNFSKVCCRRDTTSCKNLIKNILYPPKLTSLAIKWGKEKEILARQELEEILGIKINECGLFIDSEFPYFGASPDGIVGEDTIVEIKCPYAARQMSPTDAIINKVGEMYRIFNKNDDTRMNEKDGYYYQIQGQLHITQRKYCIFAIWTPFGIKHTIVERDDTFWQMKMLSPLKQFYEECLVPELIDSRAARNMPIREPQFCLNVQQATKKRKLNE